MITPVRSNTRLGNPPNEYTNNDAEASKSHISSSSRSRTLCLQNRNEKRAALRKGPFRISPGFKFL